MITKTVDPEKVGEQSSKIKANSGSIQFNAGRRIGSSLVMIEMNGELLLISAETNGQTRTPILKAA